MEKVWCDKSEDDMEKVWCDKSEDEQKKKMQLDNAPEQISLYKYCLLYTSDAADE